MKHILCSSTIRSITETNSKLSKFKNALFGEEKAKINHLTLVSINTPIKFGAQNFSSLVCSTWFKCACVHVSF